MLLPIATMGVLNLLVFLLPPDSGERVGYSITLLLAIAVFLTIASDNLPKTSSPELSFLCVKLLVDMIISSVVMFFTIIGLRFYHAGDGDDVPNCVAAMTQCILCRCCRQPKRKFVEQRETKEDNTSAYGDRRIQRNGIVLVDRVYYSDKRSRYEANDDMKIEKRRPKSLTKVTWTDVGKASDVVFFFVTLLAFASSHLSYLIYIQVV